MVRNYLLLRNWPDRRTIDIDRELRRTEAQNDTLSAGDDEKKTRLDGINSRRERSEQPE